MKVAIFYIGIGKYRVFWDEFYTSCEKFFLPNCEKKYFIFTDEFFYNGACDNIVEHHCDDKGWPDNVLLRYDMILQFKNELESFDYAFFFNGNSKFKDYISEDEFLPTQEEGGLVALSWHIYSDCHNSKFPYDRNEKSKSYIPYGEGERYYQSGISGGRVKEYLELLVACAAQTDTDYKNGVVALNHDESHINRYLLNRKVKLLGTEYGRPEEWKTPITPKMIFRDKNKVFGKETMKKFKGQPSLIKRKLRKFTFLNKTKEVILFEGGLGNQMFQYAFYLAKKRRNVDVVCDLGIVYKLNRHNGYELKRLFDIDVPVCKTLKKTYRMFVRFERWRQDRVIKLLSKLGVNLVEDSVPSLFLPSVLTPHKGLTMYKGYWQTEKYFLDIKNEITEAFKFDETRLSSESAHYLEQIKSTKSVSLHVRRGDYTTSKHVKMYGGICTLEYYNSAVEMFEKMGDDFRYYVFSDDIGWVKENMNIPCATFIDCNKGEDSWQDMFLMSSCDNNIIANSTFSWWGAWLNKNENKVVISPSKFLNAEGETDIVPDSWVKL